MKRCLSLVLGVFVFGACTAAPVDRASPQEKQADIPIPQECSTEIRKAEKIGRELYLLDMVSAIATDELLERVPGIPDKRSVGGYLPVREGDKEGRPKDSYLVYFFTRDDPPRIAYRLRVKPNIKPEFKALDPSEAAHESFLKVVRARQKALAALPKVFQPINPIVLPAEINHEKGILVYALAGASKPGVAVFGLHYRVLMPENGGSPIYVMPLSKTVIEVPVRGGPNGEPSAGLFVSHLITDCPLETHVLASLQWNLPVYVSTQKGLWRVNGDKITLTQSP